MTLVEVMRLAAGRDGIAREYATGSRSRSRPARRRSSRARRDGLSWDDAVVETFLTLLAAAPDTHVLAAAVRRSRRRCRGGRSRAGGRRRPFCGGTSRDR